MEKHGRRYRLIRVKELSLLYPDNISEIRYPQLPRQESRILTNYNPTVNDLDIMLAFWIVFEADPRIQQKYGFCSEKELDALSFILHYLVISGEREVIDRVISDVLQILTKYVLLLQDERRLSMEISQPINEIVCLFLGKKYASVVIGETVYSSLQGICAMIANRLKPQLNVDSPWNKGSYGQHLQKIILGFDFFKDGSSTLTNDLSHISRMPIPGSGG